MNLGKSNRQIQLNHLLRIMLVVAMVFAAWHVTSHDLDTSSDVSSHAECKVCRLNHVPVAKLPVLSLIVPLVLLILIRVISVVQRPTQSYRYTLGARAPPLF